MSAITVTSSTPKAEPTPPPQRSPRLPHTTPYNKGTASDSPYINDVTCDFLNPWTEEDLERFNTVHIDDYLEYILERCLQPRKAVKQSEGDGTPLVKAVHKQIHAALDQPHNKSNIGQIYSGLKNYAKVPKETDRYAPWVEATNIALQILKTVHVDDIREASPLNILAQRNDPNEVPTSHGSDELRRKPDVVFMTEEELMQVHEINNTEPNWRITLSTLCQKRLPTNTVQWGQFKATVEFERNKSNDDSLPVPYPKELRSCRDGSSSYIRPQRLSESVTSADEAPAPPGPGLEEVVGEPVPKASGSKKRGTPKTKDPMVQAAGYAAEIMSEQAMTHTHGCVIEDMVMWCWWYDRQGAIQTSGFNFTRDLPRLLVLLFAWQRFTEDDWGFIPQGQPGRTFTCDNDFEITLVEDQSLIHRPYGIVGRGTTILRATSAYKNVPLVIKLSFPEENRIPEPEILDTIQKRAADLPDVTNHILHYTATKSTDYSTSHIRERLRLNTEGARKLTIIVFEELEGCISDLNGIEMWDVGYQVNKCNQALWRLGIQHRDISASNMMYKRINGRVRGYLIDFDLASLADRESGNLDQTGTVPFMAVELLRSVARKAPIIHAYEHDAEAVCWVVLWLGVQYEGGKRVTHSFRRWEMVDPETCYEKKRTVLEDLDLHPFTEANKVLQEPIRNVLKKILLYRILLENMNMPLFQKMMIGVKIPDPDLGGWVEECDKEVRERISCI